METQFERLDIYIEESEDPIWCPACDKFYDARFWGFVAIPMRTRVLEMIRCPNCKRGYSDDPHAPMKIEALLKSSNVQYRRR